MEDGFHLAFARRDPLRGRELGIVSPELPGVVSLEFTHPAHSPFPTLREVSAPLPVRPRLKRHQ